MGDKQICSIYLKICLGCMVNMAQASCKYARILSYLDPKANYQEFFKCVFFLKKKKNPTFFYKNDS